MASSVARTRDMSSASPRKFLPRFLEVIPAAAALVNSAKKTNVHDTSVMNSYAVDSPILLIHSIIAACAG